MAPRANEKSFDYYVVTLFSGGSLRLPLTYKAILTSDSGMLAHLLEVQDTLQRNVDLVSKSKTSRHIVVPKLRGLDLETRDVFVRCAPE